MILKIFIGIGLVYLGIGICIGIIGLVVSDVPRSVTGFVVDLLFAWVVTVFWFPLLLISVHRGLQSENELHNNWIKKDA